MLEESTNLNSTTKPSPVILEHLLNISENSSGIIYVCSGEESIIEYANKATLKAWGRDSSVIGKPFIVALPELIGQPFPELVSQVYHSGIPYFTENDKADLIVDGRLQSFYFKFSYQPLKTDDGEIWGVMCTATDVTELVNAKREIESSQENLRSMIMQAPMAMCILKGENFVVDIANDGVIELWGTTADIIGHPVFEWLPVLKGQGFEQMLEQVYRTGVRVTVSEMRAELPRNGRQEPIYLNFVYEPMIGNGGHVTGIMAVATEVTEQVIARQKIEQSEEQLRQISDLMPQMVWVTDETGSPLYFNQQWYDFTASDFDESRDEGWYQYFHPEDRDNTISKWRHSLENGNIFENEFRLKNAQSASYIWVLGRAVPIRNEEGSIYKWFGTCTDINEYKQQEQQKDDFIGIASHELKTPLTSVKASLQLMQRVVKSSSSSDVLTKLVDQSARSLDKLGYLVEDLLNVTKINEGQLFLNKSDVSLTDLVDECTQYVRLDGTHSITITTDIELKVYCDAHRIEQVLINLINNAIKYAPESKEIVISIKEVAGEAMVAVSDKGPGIPAEKMSKLFDRYYRVDNSGILYSGLGLGLYINSEIIKKHQGRIGVESELGKGSTFWFTLPLSVQ